MKKNLFLLLLACMLIILTACGSDDNSGDTETKVESTDSEVVELEAETDADIIATTVALVEIMDALELDLVGIPTSYKDMPERYEGLPEVGLAMEPDLELIMSLKPDEVLTVTTLTEFVEEKYARTDLPVTYHDFESVEGMYEGINILGEKYNRVEQAEKLTTAFDEKMTEIEAKIEGLDSPKVLILLGVPGSYLVGTENSYVGDLVKRAGGVNAIEDSDVEFVAANTENLQQAEADVILRMAHGMPEAVVEMFDREFQENDIWKHFKAVQNDRVYDLEETRFGTTANLAVVEAMQELVEILYPELTE
ncbi:heme ABC transporter substrate-binding protein IsdE [Oceanobacillus sp. CAU 1775]